MAKKESCQRCGACCLTIGRTFWMNGDYEDFPDLVERKSNGDYEDYGVPCEMFEFRGEIGVCLIHERYGYEAKPAACKEYPNGELCLRQKGL